MTCMRIAHACIHTGLNMHGGTISPARSKWKCTGMFSSMQAVPNINDEFYMYLIQQGRASHSREVEIGSDLIVFVGCTE